MTLNHGLYTDTVWAVPVTFRDTAGDPIDLSGYAYVAEMVGAGIVFRFKSSGAGAGDGTLDLADAANGVISFGASIAQHNVVPAGLYRIHLKRDLTEDVWAAEGTILIGEPGAKETYLVFDAPGVESAGAMTYAQQAAAAAATATGAAATATTQATAAASSATAAATAKTAAETAQAGAVSAKTAAEAARDAASTSATSAAASASSASGYATAASGSASSAATAKTGAETAQAAAETARDAAAASATAASSSASAASTSAGNAASSASAASTSATNAASSATSANSAKTAAQSAQAAAEAAATLAVNTAPISAIGYTIDNGNVVISPGRIGSGVRVPFACTITSVTLIADQVGSAVIDIWKDSYANFPPTVADSICASAKPTLSSARTYFDSTLTGWTKSIAAGDVLFFNVDSATTITNLNIILGVSKV